MQIINSLRQMPETQVEYKYVTTSSTNYHTFDETNFTKLKPG